MKYSLLLLLILSPWLSSAQSYVDEIETGERHYITKNTSPEILKKYLASIGATDIKFDPDEDLIWGDDYAPFKVQFPNGKWQLYCHDYSNEDQIVNQTPYDSIAFPDGLYYLGLTVIKDNGMYGVLDFSEWVYGEKTKKDNIQGWYEAVEVRNIEEAVEYDLQDYLEIYVKKEGKWGKMKIKEYECCELIPVTEIKYNSIAEIPQDGFLPEKKFGRKNKIVWIEPFNMYYWKTKNKKGKWGMFMGEGEMYEIVPMKYDSVQFYEERQVTATWLDGKVGYYAESEQIKKPEYDDLELMFLDYDYAVGLKKDGYWQMYDSFEGSLFYEGKAETPDLLIEKWLNRHND